MSRAGLALSLLAACTALGLAGCGGDDEEQATSATEARAERQATTSQPAGREQTKSAEGAEQTILQGQVRDSAPDSGTESAAPGVPVTPGGDNSIQTFGAEGEVSEREQAVATLQAYLRARVTGQWERACAQTSEQFKEQVALLISQARGEGERPQSCAEALRLFTRPLPKPFLRRQSRINELLSFRVEEKDGEEYAYVIYGGAGGKVRFIAMANDEGEWKVNTVQPEEFPSVEGQNVSGWP